jgi:hypothetical protein
MASAREACSGFAALSPMQSSAMRFQLRAALVLPR